jgi:hypothetical protein
MSKIRNNHNVYVLGAGFSAARGLPVMSTFMFSIRDAHEWLIREGRTAEAASVERVLDFRLKSTPSAYRVRLDLENIEELFSLASAIDDSLADDIRTAVAATLDHSQSVNAAPVTRFNLETGGPFVPEGLKAEVVQPGMTPNSSHLQMPTYQFMVSALLGRLSPPRSGMTNALLSFNYDTLVEEALSAQEEQFSYGFPARTVTEDETAARLSLVSEPQLSVLKLHGSTNWAFPRSQGQRLKIFGSYSDIRQREFVPELIPPTWRKSLDGPLSYVWKSALAEISRATRIVVIGFSMPLTDLHFKYLLAAGLRENISLREIVFVNSNVDSIKGRVGELFGDFNRRPVIRMVHLDARNFIAGGTFDSSVGSIGRPLHPSFLQVFHT